MNNFATIVKLYSFREVTFYSILIEGERKPLGMQFLETHSKHPHFNVLMAWINKIGNDYAAATYYFRAERNANALPPPIHITQKECNLRWYCLRMSPAAVVLFNGGEKTTRYAQDCPNVSDHFAQANTLSDKIWDAFDDGEIKFDQEDRLVIDDDFIIEF